MIVEAYRISEQNTLEEVGTEGALDIWRKDKKPLWLMIEQAGTEDIAAFLEPLDLPPVLMEQCLATETGAQVLPLEDFLVLQFPINGPDGAVYISALLLPNLAIVVRPDPTTVPMALSRIAADGIKLPNRTPAALLGALLATVSRRDMEAVFQQRAALNRMAEDQEEDAESVEIEDILHLKRQLRELETVSEEKRYCFETLSRTRSGAFKPKDAGSHMQIALGNAEYMERLVDRLSARAEDLHSHHLVWLQERTNKRLATLTVLSAIFLPLTLIAGIEGMNFEQMPELKWALGYPAILGLMVSIAVGLTLLFWRKGWFD